MSDSQSESEKVVEVPQWVSNLLFSVVAAVGIGGFCLLFIGIGVII